MIKFNIQIDNDSLDESKVAEVLEILASGIRQEELTELMDGSHQIETVYGKVWIEIEE